MGLMRLWLTSVTALVLCLPLHAQTGDRVALVIGNSSYPKAPLSNPRNDATGVAGLFGRQDSRSTSSWTPPRNNSAPQWLGSAR